MNQDLLAPAMDDAHWLHEGIIVAQDRHALLFARNRELHRQFGWSPEACSETAWGKDAALHATPSRFLEQLRLLDCLIAQKGGKFIKKKWQLVYYWAVCVPDISSR
jgi:hypothetical protein